MAFPAQQGSCLHCFKFENLVVKGSAGAKGATSSHKVAVDDKVLMSCAQNALTIRFAFLSDFNNKRIMELV